MDSPKKVISIVSYMAGNQTHHSVTHIAAQLGLNKSTAYRILKSLESIQWVVQDPTIKKYRLGIKAFETGLSLFMHFDIKGLSLPHLYNLRDLTQETAVLCLRIGFERVFMEQVQSNYEVRQVVELGKRHPLWLGAPGKVILAFMDENEIDMILSNIRRSGTILLASGQILDVNQLKAELVEIKEKGYAVSVSERIFGGTGIAAPIIGHNHQVIGAVGILGALPRFTVAKAINFSTAVSQAAQDLSNQISSPSKTIFEQENGKSRRYI